MLQNSYRLSEQSYIRYFVLKLCQATLRQYANDEYSTGHVPCDRDALMQMTEGLAHIHENQLIIRDLSPNNILIQQNSVTSVMLKISDSGFCKPTSESGSHLESEQWNQGKKLRFSRIAITGGK